MDIINNLSLKLSEAPTPTIPKKSIFNLKHHSVNNESSIRSVNKPISNHLYSLHHKEYDYSIISKHSKRIPNSNTKGKLLFLLTIVNSYEFRSEGNKDL